MDVGVIVSIVFGCLFICGGFLSMKNRGWRRKNIKEWASCPTTTVRITGTTTKKDHHSRSGNTYDGYYYDGELFIDGEWHRAKSYDTFWEKRSCENGEELIVAYKPIPETNSSKILDSMMGAMTKTLLNEDWEDRKPRYYFKFLDEKKYLNEEKIDFSSWFFVGFGLLIIAIGVYYGIVGE